MKIVTFVGSLIALVSASLGCGDQIVVAIEGPGGGGGAGGAGAGGDGSGGVPGPSTSDKIDLLLVVDNSRGMTDAQGVLRASIPSLVDGLVAAGARDMHVGVISTSLGGLGADACTGTTDPSEDDRAHLLARDGLGGQVPTYGDLGFLAWDPNQALSPPGEDDAVALTDAARALVAGAGAVGCGYESQLESLYRFLVDPDPYQSIALINEAAHAEGIDDALLAQRADFLRPDSLVLIVSLSDENDCSTRHEGQFFFARQIYNPGTSNPYHLPPARAACATNPADPCCLSCGQAPKEGCSTEHDSCGGSLPPLEDNIDVRCFDQKRRFGIDFLWPVERYDAALSTAQVADRHGNVVGNPLFTGQRGSELVLFAAIVGAPYQLTSRNGDPGDGSHIASELDEAAWRALIGNPASYTPPEDPHMIESITPRAGLTSTGADPIHGHEHSIPQKDDLQYACIFPLATARDCTGVPNCPCNDPANDSPICTSTTQIAASAYPAIRQLSLLRGLGHRGVAGSLCPAPQLDPSEPDFGYRPTFETLLELVRERLE